MGLGDTFDFDEYAYQRAISNSNVYTTHRLKTQEVVKLRQHVSAGASIGIGIGLAPLTFGASLLGSAYGARRLQIATKKLAMIEAELTKREVELHSPTKRDFLIPLGVSFAGLGLGAGLDAAAGHVTSQVAAHAVADHGTRAAGDVLQHSGAFVDGVKDGVVMQVHEVTDVVTGGIAHATLNANIDSSFLLAGAHAADPALLVGISAGVAGAHLAEARLVQWASGKVAMKFVDRLLPNRTQGFTFARPETECTWYEQSSRTGRCAHCSEVLGREIEPFFHCCSCDDDELDLCEDCVRNEQKGCHNHEKHILYLIIPNKAEEEGWEVCSRVGKDQVRLPFCGLECDYCHRSISEENYYHCCDDSDEPGGGCDIMAFDMCSNCYNEGLRCRKSNHTSLTLLPEPRKNLKELAGIRNKQEVKNSSSSGPAIVAQGQERLVVAFVHSIPRRQGHYDLMIMTSLTGAYWGGKVKLGPEYSTSASSPSLAYDPETCRTYLGWCPPCGGFNIAETTSTAHTLDDWGKPQPMNSIGHSVSLTVAKGVLCAAWTDRDDCINVGTIKRSPKGNLGWSKQISLEDCTLRAPRLSSAWGVLLLSWVSEDGAWLHRECKDPAALEFDEEIDFVARGKSAPTFSCGPDGDEGDVWVGQDEEDNICMSVVVEDEDDEEIMALSLPCGDEKTGSQPAVCYFQGKQVIAWQGIEGSVLRPIYVGEVYGHTHKALY